MGHASVIKNMMKKPVNSSEKYLSFIMRYLQVEVFFKRTNISKMLSWMMKEEVKQ